MMKRNYMQYPFLYQVKKLLTFEFMQNGRGNISLYMTNALKYIQRQTKREN